MPGKWFTWITNHNSNMRVIILGSNMLRKIGLIQYICLRVCVYCTCLYILKTKRIQCADYKYSFHLDVCKSPYLLKDM